MQYGQPYYLDEEALKYIDYDLDVKVFTDGEKRLLDVEEYERHKRKMKYSDDLDYILKEHVKILVDWINNGRGPFSEALCQHLVQTLHRTKESVKLSNWGESPGFYLKNPALQLG